MEKARTQLQLQKDRLSDALNKRDLLQEQINEYDKIILEARGMIGVLEHVLKPEPPAQTVAAPQASESKQSEHAADSNAKS